MVKASVHGIISGIPMPFPFPQPDACVDSGLACPLQNGQDYTYTTQIPISSSYPKVDVSWFSILSRVLPGSRGSDKVGSRQTEGFFFVVVAYFWRTSSKLLIVTVWISLLTISTRISYDQFCFIS